MHPEALGVGHPVERDLTTIAGALLAVGAVTLHRPPAVRREGERQVAEVARGTRAARIDGDRGKSGRTECVRDAKTDGVEAGAVGPRRRARSRVAEDTVTVEIPRVGDRIAVGIRAVRRVEDHVQGRGTARRIRNDGGKRSLVRGGVLHAMDGAGVEVDVEEVATRPDLQLDRRAGPGDERRPCAWIGQAILPGEHHPDAAPRVVGEEERPAVLGRVAAALVEG